MGLYKEAHKLIKIKPSLGGYGRKCSGDFHFWPIVTSLVWVSMFGDNSSHIAMEYQRCNFY